MMLPQVCHADLTDGTGQIIHIRTNLHRLIGSARLSIVIRDIDHNQNIPYIFEIDKPNNTWLLYTHSRNYVILSSSVQINRYNACCNQYKNIRISNFCQLESCGRIMKNRAMSVIITGVLSPHPYTYNCRVTPHPTSGFTIVTLPDCPCPKVATPIVTGATGVAGGPAPLVAAAPAPSTVLPGETAPVITATTTNGLPQVAAVTSTPVIAAQPVVSTPVVGGPIVATSSPGTGVVAVPGTPVTSPQTFVSAPREVPLVVEPPQLVTPSPVIPRVPGGPP
jgi:hypothetical protein